jgi:hypothetical protein
MSLPLDLNIDLYVTPRNACVRVSGRQSHPKALSSFSQGVSFEDFPSADPHGIQPNGKFSASTGSLADGLSGLSSSAKAPTSR